ncbi:MAG: DUF3299 domain-containing protein [Burkholderiaceae bacterium]
MHSPPPPANQMVFVRAEKSFKTAGLFEPVWVQGVIKADHGNHKLTLVDGSDDVEAGYSMADARIEAYRAR